MDEQISDRQDGSAPAQRPSASVGRASVPGLIASRPDEPLPQAKAASVYRAIPSGDEGDLAGDEDGPIERMPADVDVQEKPVGSVHIPTPRQGEPPAQDWHDSALADPPPSQPEPSADAWPPSHHDFAPSLSRSEAPSADGSPQVNDLLPPGEPLPRRTARRDAAPWLDLAMPEPIPGTPFSAFGPKSEPKPVEDQNPYRVRATARVPGLTPSTPPDSPSPASEPQRPAVTPIAPTADPLVDRRPAPETGVPTALDPQPAAAPGESSAADSLLPASEAPGSDSLQAFDSARSDSPVDRLDLQSGVSYSAPDSQTPGSQVSRSDAFSPVDSVDARQSGYTAASASGSAAVAESPQVRPPTYRGSASPTSRPTDAPPPWAPPAASTASGGPVESAGYSSTFVDQAEAAGAAQSAEYSTGFAEPAEAEKAVEPVGYSSEFASQARTTDPAEPAGYSSTFVDQAEAAGAAQFAVYSSGFAEPAEAEKAVESAGYSSGVAEPMEAAEPVGYSSEFADRAEAAPAESADYSSDFSWPAESAVYPASASPVESSDQVGSVAPSGSSWSTSAPSESDSPAESGGSAVPWADAVPAESSSPVDPFTSSWTSSSWAATTPAADESSPAESAAFSEAALPEEALPAASVPDDEPIPRGDRDLRELFGFGAETESDVEDDSFGAYWTPDEPRPDLDKELAKFGAPDQVRDEAPAADPVAPPADEGPGSDTSEPGLAWRSLVDEPDDRIDPDPVMPPSIGRVRAAVRVPGLTIEPPPPGSAIPGEAGAAPVPAATKTPEIEAPVDEPVPVAGVSDDEDRPLAVPRAIEFDGAPAVKSTTAPPVQPPPPAPLVNYSVEDWRSNVRGSAVVNVEAAGTVYRGELGGPDEPEPISTAQRIMRYAFVTILLALFVLAFLYGPKIDEWFSS